MIKKWFGHVVIPQKQWQAHKKYVRRLRRKERQKAIALNRAQEQLRSIDFATRQAGLVMSVISKQPKLLAGVCVLLFSSTAAAQCVGGQCYPRPVAIAPQPAMPSIIQQPVITYQPLYLQGSSYTPRTYPTPLRNFFFGRGSWNAHYGPTPPQAQQPQEPARRPANQPQPLPEPRLPERAFIPELTPARFR